MTLQLSAALYQASESGNVDEVRRLLGVLGHVPEHVLGIAVNKNHPLVVRVLCPYANEECITQAISMAAEWGFLECVKELVPHCKGHAILYAAGEASGEGRLEVLQYLISLCDVKQFASYPLQMACIGENTTMVEYLYPLSDPKAALAELLKMNGKNSTTTQFLMQLVENEQQNARLHEHIQTPGAERSRKI